MIIYDGPDRSRPRLEQTGARGYALGFEGLFEWLELRLPRNEQMRGVRREDVPLYPIAAVRELVANALVHQDFSITGAGPMVEVFEDRIEVANPGVCLVPVDRLIDEPPQSRNELIAFLMRMIGYCEERGSGIDKVVGLSEVFQLPAPQFEKKTQSFVATLFAPRAFNEMTGAERMRACYQHACLLWVSGGKRMTNSSLRQRFGLPRSRVSQISRLIGETLDAGIIKPFDPNNRSRAQAAYQPYWA